MTEGKIPTMKDDLMFHPAPRDSLNVLHVILSVGVAPT
jgi:hypothetical protein